MIHVSILVLRRAELASLSDAMYVFNVVNDLLVQSGKEALFNVQLVGLAEDVTLNDGAFIVHPHTTIDKVQHTDLIIIPSMTGGMHSFTYPNREYAHWIATRYKNGSEVASFCVGAFLLAYSGLLRGKQCTTHWMYANEFRAHYPDVKLVHEKIITNQNGLYSSGGATSYWNLLLYLVEKYTDREMAIQVSKHFVIDIARTSQSPFAVFSGVKDHEDKIIKLAQEHIECHYLEKTTVDDLAKRFNTGRRTFERRFKKATSITVVEYMQRVKIEEAKKQLETGRKTVNEVMYEVGYSDSKAFREVFRKITGLSPIVYRERFNKDAINPG